MLYRIEVKNQGNLVANHTIEALDALTAINQVERYYGDPVMFEMVLIEDEHGRKRPAMVVTNWHGYAFEARAIRLNGVNQESPPSQERSSGNDVRR